MVLKSSLMMELKRFHSDGTKKFLNERNKTAAQ